MINHSDADEPKVENPVTQTVRQLCSLTWQKGREAKIGSANPFLTYDPTVPLSLQDMCADIWDDGHDALPEDANPYQVEFTAAEQAALIGATEVE